MSPSEADLRAALREGEGDGVDPDDIIGNARHARARRRSMVLSAAAAVVVVAATAAGVTALVHGAGSPNSGAGGAAQANAPANVPAGGNTAAGSHHVPAPQNPHHSAIGREPGIQIAPSCGVQKGSVPSSPGGAASGFLLAGPVKQFVVCAYSAAGMPTTSAISHWVPITGQAARQLAESLQNLSATSIPKFCPAVTSTGNAALRIVPITPMGQHLPAITAKIGLPACATLVTNGRIVRYGWHLPPRVAALLPLTSNGPGTFQLIPPVRGESGAPPR